MSPRRRASILPAARGQRGAVLVISLLLLVVMTVLAIDAMRSANFNVALATNTQEQGRSFAVAESGLADAEAFILANHPSTPIFDWSASDTDGLFMPGDLAASPVTGVDWSANNGAYETGASGSRYTVEYLGSFSVSGGSLTTGAGAGPEQRYLYLITARGESAGGSVRYVQSVFVTSN